MSPLQNLVDWGASLSLAQVPEDVIRRAQLRHLSTLSTVPSTHSPLVLLNSWQDPPDLVGHIGGSAYTDFGPNGVSAYGSILGAWTGAKETTPFSELLVSGIVADEISLRLGLAATLDSVPGPGRIWQSALATTVAIGRVLQLPPDLLRHAIEHALTHAAALSQPTVASRASREANARVAFQLASAAIAEASSRPSSPAPAQSLDETMAALGIQPILPNTLGGLGSVWLSRWMTFCLTPAMPWAQTSLQAFHEILRRHVNAAGKRLRPDQVEEVEIRLDHSSFLHATQCIEPNQPLDDRLSASIPLAVAHLIHTCPDALGPWDLGTRDPSVYAGELSQVATLVRLVPDLGLTTKRLRFQAHLLGRLFGALPYRSRMRAGMKQASALLTKYPPISPRDVIQCLKKNPFEALLDLSQTPGGLDTLANIRPHLSRPTEIRLRTTRGGLWIERRDVVEGGPEYALSDLQDHTLAKFEQVWGAGSDWHAHQLIHPNSTWSAHRVLNLERHP